MNSATSFTTGPAPLVAADMEGTLSAGYAWHGLRNYLLSHGYQGRYRRLALSRLPGILLFKLQLIDTISFKENWMLKLLRLYRGFSRRQFDDMAVWLVENELWPRRRRAVIARLLAHQAQGRRVVIISGLFQPILQRFVEKLPGCKAIGTPLNFVDDIFSGEIEGEFNVGPRKVIHLKRLSAGRQLEAAYGDTARDIPMLKLSRHPVAVCPDTGLRQAAASLGWEIVPALEQPDQSGG